MSIRTRFTFTVVAIVAATVTLFASLSIIALDRTLRSSFQSRLHSDAQAIATTVDVHDGRASVDPSDLRALAPLGAAVSSFSVEDSAGNRIAGDPLPAGTRGVEIASAPVTRGTRSFATVTVWQSNAWIGEFDRNAALVSIAVGVLLTGLGAFISRRVADRVLAMFDRLEEAFARERRFVADASHELRAPLAVLRAETELALRRERTDDEYRAALQSIAHEATRLEELVDELLAASRAEVDAQQRETLDASELVREIGTRVRPAAAAREIAVTIDAAGSVLARANRGTVERALLAVAHNAIEYGRERGTVRMSATRENGLVRIQIADDGPGFTSDALQHATERFWRGDNGRPRGGTGLGLAIARTMVEANGGALKLGNAANSGAVVTFELAAALG
jgi:signal transduction histidine kinase